MKGFRLFAVDDRPGPQRHRRQLLGGCRCKLAKDLDRRPRAVGELYDVDATGVQGGQDLQTDSGITAGEQW